MGRALDRLPLDYAEPRKEGGTVPHEFNTEGLNLLPVSEDVRWDARRALTLRHLKGEDFTDNATVWLALGLASKPAAGATGPMDVPCPTCAQPPGARCKSSGSGQLLQKPHRTRYRLGTGKARTS